MKRVLILGATSNISHYLIPMLLKQDIYLTLFARHGRERLSQWIGHSRVHVMSGDWNQPDDLAQAMKHQEIIFLATGQFTIANQKIVNAMRVANVKRLIVAAGLGIEDEIPGKFGQWNRKMMGNDQNLKAAANIIKKSGLNYTLMRMAWLYNCDGNEQYELIPQGQPFEDTQLSRQGAARFVADVVANPKLAAKESVGVAEPHTHWDKPSFY